jgi:hypothetical protein
MSARARLIVPALFAIATAVAPARAQEAGAAELLFDQGRKLLEEGKLDEACAKLEASQKMDPAVGTLLNLADCNDRRGRVATAWTNYRAATSLAETKGDAARAEFARKRAKALEPRIPTLTIRVVSPEPGLVVKRDGAALEDAAWGMPVPIDPGSHVVEASASGKQTWSKRVDVAAASMVVEVPQLAAIASAPPPPRERPTSAPEDDEGRTMRTFGIASGAAGLVAVGIGTVFAIRAASVWNDAKPHCLNDLCDDTGYSLNHDARTNGDVATVALVTGAVLLAAGAALYFLAPQNAQRFARRGAWVLP